MFFIGKWKLDKNSKIGALNFLLHSQKSQESFLWVFNFLLIFFKFEMKKDKTLSSRRFSLRRNLISFYFKRWRPQEQMFPHIDVGQRLRCRPKVNIWLSQTQASEIKFLNCVSPHSWLLIKFHHLNRTCICRLLPWMVHIESRIYLHFLCFVIHNQFIMP